MKEQKAEFKILDSVLSRRDFSKLASLSPFWPELRPIRASPGRMKAGNPNWPVLTQYDQSHLTEIAMPIGGIGTGTISLGGRGDLRDWEIGSHPAKGFKPKYSFFTLHLAGPGKKITRVLEGQIFAPYRDPVGFRLTDYGLPRFRHCTFLAAYPFGQVLLEDETVPARVRLEAFNPLIPGDADHSGLPILVLRYVVTNTASSPVTATVCGSVSNFLGTGSSSQAVRRNNRFRQDKAASVKGLVLDSEGLPADSPENGSVALATPSVETVTYRLLWKTRRYGDGLRDFWEDLADDGQISDPKEGQEAHASLAITAQLAPGQTREFPFLITWHFPNRREWSPSGAAVGNYYATQFSDAWDVAILTAPAAGELEEKTRLFVQSFCDSTLPVEVQEAALNNISTLRTQTCFRTADGYFFGWEGSRDDSGCCPGSCTHVWNYDQTLPFLFADLARLMREVEFEWMVEEDGFMPIRVGLPLLEGVSKALEKIAAVDGQMGCILKLYREWQLSGDEGFLRRLWPHARRSLEFCWVDRGWDSNRDGILEGPQHTTTDIEYFGPNPVGQTWYLGALRAAGKMASFLGETQFAALCEELFESGRSWSDNHLFNGQYYEQRVELPRAASEVDPRLVTGRVNWRDPEYQIGDGCQSDQLVGQWMAHIIGLGDLLEPEHLKSALRSVMRFNFRKPVGDSIQYFRTFALNQEAALLFGTYPRSRPEVPNFRFSEVWTGIEYAVAAEMMYEGLIEASRQILQAVRERYDGYKRNPFNETECGFHYVRAMAAWSCVLAMTGFHYSAVEGILTFRGTSDRSSFFWSNGSAWGRFEQRPAARSTDVVLRVSHGRLKLRQIVLTGVGAANLGEATVLSEQDDPLKITVRQPN